MVSRTLEKMILVAVGLTTAVMIGVPVLLFAINTLNSATEYELAQLFSEKLHEAVLRVDNGSTQEVDLELTVPEGVELVADENTLTVSYQSQHGGEGSWTEAYSHPLIIEPPPVPGYQSLTVRMLDDVILISFVSVA